MAELIIGLAGDVLVDRALPHEVFDEVREVLAAPQILFANLEGAYTDDPHPAPSAPVVIGPRARNLDAFAAAGFNVMSLANNHILDVGYAAMLDTRARLRAQGIATCGAGDNLADARRPAIVSAEGLRVAFLAYSSVFPAGYQARFNRPGLVPVREHRYWFDQDPHYYSGATPAFVTMPERDDIDALTRDIGEARKDADLVVASFHWGDYLSAFTLTDHERRLARHAVDCGADLVVGHHHHALRGIEYYQGRPIMYGLGHFVFDLRLDPSEEARRAALGIPPDSYAVAPRDGWPLLPLHPDTRMTVLAWARVVDGRIADVGFLPCCLTSDGLVHPLDRESREGQEVIAYLQRCQEVPGLNGRMIASELRLGGFATMGVVPAQ